MAYDKLFIETGATPPRGSIVKVEIVRPSAHNAKHNGATIMAFGNPYRRVYQDDSGLYVFLHGRKARAYMVEN
jgi:hypothetical protein